MIVIVFILSTFFHLLYWITKGLTPETSWASAVHLEFNHVFGWYTLLQLMAAASLFADTIIRWDEWKEKGQSKTRMTFMILCVFAWICQVLLAVVDLYTAGGLQ